MHLVNIDANGYCFINSVLTCLYNDYGDTLTLEDCITKIVSHLCLNHQNYSTFHNTEKPAYAADKLVSNVLDFFHSGNFNVNVVDLLMQITCDALKLHLFIYQRHEEHIQVLSFRQQNAEHSRHIAASERVIHMRFTHNNLHTGGIITMQLLVSTLQNQISMIQIYPHLT